MEGMAANRGDVPFTPGNGGSYGHPGSQPSAATTSQFPSRGRPLPAAPTQGLRPRAKSASNLLSRPDKTVEFHDDTGLIQRRGADDGLAELIDFLRNQAPPPDNFMSIPDGVDGQDRRRWSMLKRLGKKKGSRTPHHIRLPDSAVSGITTGGHRHIAISIPLAASPFGQNPRSQYPIYQQGSFYQPGKPITARYAPTRAVLNEKGVVTVLQGITEDSEPYTFPSASSPSHYQLSSNIPRSAGNPSIGTYSPAGLSRSFSTNGVRDYQGLVPIIPLRTSPRGDIVRIDNPETQAQSNSLAADRTTSLHHRASFPMRASSLNGGRLTAFPENSIDAVMSQPERSQEVPMGGSLLSRPVSQGESSRHSLSKSIVTTSEHDPIVADAKRITTSRSTPIFLGESPIMGSVRRMEDQPVTVITQNPLAPTKAKTPAKEKPIVPVIEPESPGRSPAPSIKSTQSRKERVREKKLRDIEKVRNAQLKRQSQLIPPEAETTAPVPPEKSLLRISREGSESSKTQSDDSPQGPKICPIMIVADVRPSPPPEESKAPKPPPKDRPKKTAQKAQSSTKGESSKPAAPPPVIYLNHSDHPTPPQSSAGSPAHKPTSMDRTSLSRRREWNAVREQERRIREQERKAEETKAAIRAKARQLVQDSEEPESSSSKLPPMEQEVLRRYEAYREYRIREMERRVRRLERNGDVWLRALVPVLDNLNRTLANVHEERPSRAQGWISDDETTTQNETRGRSIGYRRQQQQQQQQGARDRAVRRSTTSERQFLEQLVRKREELAAGSGSDDLSGLDTIEPLMRELAGRSRLSFEARKTLGAEGEGVGTY